MGRCYVIPRFPGWLAGSENHWKNVGKPTGQPTFIGNFGLLRVQEHAEKRRLSPSKLVGPRGIEPRTCGLRVPFLCKLAQLCAMES